MTQAVGVGVLVSGSGTNLQALIDAGIGRIAREELLDRRERQLQLAQHLHLLKVGQLTDGLEALRALCEREGVSQAVLARHLNVAVKLVGEWERGEKRPSGPSLKLLSLVKAKGLEAIG